MKDCSPIGLKMADLWPIKDAQIWLFNLVYNLAKQQYHIYLALYLLICPKKPLKMVKNHLKDITQIATPPRFPLYFQIMCIIEFLPYNLK